MCICIDFHIQRKYTHPCTQGIWICTESWAKWALASGCPPLFNRRGCRNILFLDQVHELLDVFHILHIWFLYCASWETDLRDPLLTSTVKAQNLITPTYSHSFTFLPVFSFHLIDLQKNIFIHHKLEIMTSSCSCDAYVPL